MARPAERDWETIYRVWQATTDRHGKRLSVRKFCEVQGLPSSSAYDAFAKIEAAEKADSGNSRKPEPPGKAAENPDPPETSPETGDVSGNSGNLPAGVATGAPGDFAAHLESRKLLAAHLETCRDALGKLATWANDYDTGGAGDPKDVRAVAGCLKDVVGTLQSLHPVLAESEAAAAKSAILHDCLANRISAEEAALRFELIGLEMPEAVRIVLSRTPVPEPAPAEEDIPDDAELDQIYEASVAKIEAQRETWLPDRRAGITDLKGQMAVEAGEGYVRADGHPGDLDPTDEDDAPEDRDRDSPAVRRALAELDLD